MNCLEVKIFESFNSKSLIIQYSTHKIAAVTEEAANFSRLVIVVNSLCLKGQGFLAYSASVILCLKHRIDLINGHSVSTLEIISYLASLRNCALMKSLCGTCTGFTPTMSSKFSLWLTVELCQYFFFFALGAVFCGTHDSIVPQLYLRFNPFFGVTIGQQTP